MRILHLSDLHFGYEDGAAIAAIHRFVQDGPPDLIVASGDLSAAGLQTELDACATWLSSLGPPVIATPGNHDAPYFEVLPRFYRPFRRFRRAARGRMAAFWHGEEVWIVSANTARGWQLRLNWALGAIGWGQVHRLSQELAAAPAGALKIVVTHHPLVWPRDPALSGATHRGVAAAGALVRAGAHLFLSGHLHVMRDTPLREGETEALAVTGGTLCTRLRGDPQGFNVIELKDGRVSIERHGITAGQIGLLSVRSVAFAGGKLTVDTKEEPPAGPAA